MKNANRLLVPLLSIIGLIAVGANPALADNMGCCVTGATCTTATDTVCTLLGGTIQGIGTEICVNDECVAGIGCASCVGGVDDGNLCEDDNECTPPGTCEEVVNPIPTVSEWGMIVMVLLALTAGTVVFARWRRPATA